mmetsp:Transcript_14066/g.26560  ORF Transcript_14066/g.26560 Transcript_14066/m.26560 type:complete len:229 (+) Transcript_14066:4811-5497(+)
MRVQKVSRFVTFNQALGDCPSGRCPESRFVLVLARATHERPGFLVLCSIVSRYVTVVTVMFLPPFGRWCQPRSCQSRGVVKEVGRRALGLGALLGLQVIDPQGSRTREDVLLTVPIHSVAWSRGADRWLCRQRNETARSFLRIFVVPYAQLVACVEPTCARGAPPCRRRSSRAARCGPSPRSPTFPTESSLELAEVSTLSATPDVAVNISCRQEYDRNTYGTRCTHFL